VEPTRVRELEQIIGPKNVFTAVEDLVSYSFDGTFAEHRPDVVVQPATTQEVSRILALADREGWPPVWQPHRFPLAVASR
jgi:glycolate oxidase